MDVSELVERFRHAANEKGEVCLPMRRDHRPHQEMAAAWRDLQNSGQLGRDAFKALLRDGSSRVRAWVAAQLLSEGDVDAVPVLQQLAHEAGLRALSAKMTLSEWRSGRLRSPFA